MLEICTSHYSKASKLRHPRVQLQMLKDIFGGDEMVENVKIVPDRNVYSSLLFH
jgi:hypothetical protein